MLSLPLNIENGKLSEEERLKSSIDQYIDLLLTTSCYSNPVDPEFGFIFNNLKFEIFNENEGVVYNSSSNEDIFEGRSGMYDKKVSGSSKNLNTFASDLKSSINKYEKRLTEIAVAMTYVREERLIFINVKGRILETGDEYSYTSTLRVWK